MTNRRSLAWVGAILLSCVSLPLAAAGPGMVAAATWVEERGGTAPGWLLGIFGDGAGLSGAAFYILLWAAFVAYLLLIANAAVLSRRALWTLVVGLTVVFVLAPPLLSQDVFSYLAYARLGFEHGLNPYLATPAAVPSDPVFAFVGWPDAVSVYGPAFTIASFALAPLSLAAGLWTFKAVTAAAVLAVALLTEKTAARRDLEPKAAVAIVALNPLVLAHVIGGAHNDALLALGLTATLAFMVAGRTTAAGTSLVLAVAVKVSAAFLAPFALIATLRERGLQAFLTAALFTFAALAIASLALFGGAVFDSLALVGDNQGASSRYSLPATASRVFGLDLDFVRAVFLALWAFVVAGLIAWCVRGGDWIRAAAWAGLATLLASGWLLPWYLIWILPLVAVVRDRALLAATLALTAFQLINRIPL